MKNRLKLINNKLKLWKDKIIKTMRRRQEEKFTSKEVMIIASFALGIGILMSFSITNIIKVNNHLSVQKELKKFVDSYNAIMENYYGDIDQDKLINGAITGMTNTLEDPYTTYIDSKTAQNFLETVEGTYQGIGCEIGTNEDQKVIVTNIIPNTPASRSNLKAKDIILKIDGEDYTTKTSTDVADYIKNTKQEKITLTIQREKEQLNVEIIKEQIIIPSVSSEIIKKNNTKIGYIYISLFSSVTNKQFREELKRLEEEKISSLIIDVRNNTGGYLDVVSDICSIMLSKNKIIYQLEGKEGTVKYYDKTDENRKYPIAVLINDYSASASEILASAIKESYGGYVIGINSYGKGTAQQTFTLSDGSLIKYTNQKWLTPKGNWINKIGVTPTNYIEMNEEYYNDPIKEKDTQLNEAIKILQQ